MSRTIDRTRPPYRDSPVIAALTDEQVWSLADAVARLLASYARRLEAEGVTVEDLERMIAAETKSAARRG